MLAVNRVFARPSSTSRTRPPTTNAALPCARANTPTRLWRWHCREELAHHALLPLLQQSHGVPRTTRVTALLAASLALSGDALSLWATLCRLDVRAGRSTRTQRDAPMPVVTTVGCP